jgi:hypothetical protein
MRIILEKLKKYAIVIAVGQVASGPLPRWVAIEIPSPQKGPAHDSEGPLLHDIISQFKRKAVALDDPFLPGSQTGSLHRFHHHLVLHTYYPQRGLFYHPVDHIAATGACG